MPFLNFRPTVVLPRVTATRAYSTWNRRPSGLKTVIARSYAIWPGCILINLGLLIKRSLIRVLLSVPPNANRRVQVLPRRRADRPRGGHRRHPPRFAPH